MKDQKQHRSRGRLAQGVFVLFMVMALLIVFSGAGTPTHADDGPPPPPPDSLKLPEDFVGKRVQELRVPNMTSSLNALLDTWEQDPVQAVSFAASRGLELRADSVKVMLIMVDKDSANSALEPITANGGEVIAHYKRWVDAWVPISALESLAALPGVSQVREAIPVLPLEEMQAPDAKALAAGSALTQGVAASNADAWHTAGITGSGVDVAVIDSFKDYATAQANGDLPASISTYGTLDTSSRHGTAVAEIIYDMAPGVDFTFASPGTATQMATYIVDLAAAGNDIISSSMGFYNAEPGDGTGPVSDAINTAHDTYGTLYVQAAGNQATYHWDGNFNDSYDGDGWHEFAGGGVEINSLDYLPSGLLLYINLRWNSWPVTDQDYDLIIFYWDGDSWEIVAVSENWQTGTQPPTESILYYTEYTAYYGIAIAKYSATGTQVLDLMGHNAPSFEYNVSNRSLIDPATPEDSFSVAAVDVTPPYTLEWYSSWGPTHGPGGAIGGGMDKPRITGFANVDTWAYGAGVFNGTSSATPHVSGASALVLEANPSYTPDQIMSFLEDRAVDDGDPGYDYKYGAGRLYLGDPPSAGTEMLNNGVFEIFVPNYWKGVDITADDGPDCTTAATGDCSTIMMGNGTVKQITYVSALSGSAGDNFSFSLWNRADAAGGPFFAKIVLIYTDASQAFWKILPDKGTHGWQSYNVDFTAAKNYSRVRIFLLYGAGSGSVWLDDVSLTKY
jgi:hypothetical protein